MSVLVIIESRVKAERLEDMTATVAKRVPEARKFPGCQEVDVYFDTEDPCRMWTVGTWDSIEANNNYMSWRKETGVAENLNGGLESEYKIRYFKKLDC